MNNQNWESKNFIHLKEEDFNIETCEIDFLSISVRYSDLSRYRKAFRVKIRTLIKTADAYNLVKCIEKFYDFAGFVRYLYGYHSCANDVEPWQEQVALFLQKEFVVKNLKYKIGTHLKYEHVDFYEEHFKTQYKLINPKCDVQTQKFIQDGKSFLNLKDYTHFKKWYKIYFF